MNIHRILFAVGQDHFAANPVGVVHRAISRPSLARWRLDCANESLAHSTPTPSWRLAHGATSAATALRKVDNAIDATFGTCFAHRSAGRPAWESEGYLARLGKIPLQGCTLAGALLGSLYGRAFTYDKAQAAVSGARLGAMLGGSIAFLWSQSMALIGFAAKLLLLVGGSAYMTTAHAFDSLDAALAKDVLLSGASGHAWRAKFR